MLNINNFVLGFHFLFFATVSAYGQSENQDGIEDLFTLVRGEYSGDSAYNTVAYVEKFWRIAGNEGFNKSIHKVEQILKWCKTGPPGAKVINIKSDWETPTGEFDTFSIKY